MDPFDMGEGNRVTSVEKRGEIYIVNGHNNKNEPRSIQIHPDGSIKNYLGDSNLVGYVEKQMKANLDAILKHFEITLPSPKQQREIGVSAETPTKGVSSETPTQKVSVETPTKGVSSETPIQRVSSETPISRKQEREQPKISEEKSLSLIERLAKAVENFATKVQKAFEAAKEWILGSDNQNRKGPSQ
ncbi:hypothetical protein [Legionella pneumophila]|uniref:hypothetical protein n=1 Tax=Legionella pneumophila TaxID=446 RepID=UPI0007774EBA|nr:hypothetical protein [Legionella pneumophila]